MSKVKLYAVGDVMLGDSPACFGFGVGSKIKENGPYFPFDNIRDVLADSDILFGNLETVLSHKKRNRWLLPRLYMRGDPGDIPALRDCSFKVMSISNNHMMQHGTEAFHDTVKRLESNSIYPIGMKSELPFHSKPFITKINDIKIGFLSYSLRPEEYRPKEVLYCLGEEEDINDDIHKLKKDVDFVIISIHWGDEYIKKPSPSQIAMARRIIDEGANIILGHHPHVLQGIESYKDGLIAYSLGNFVFDMWMPETRKSIILQIHLDKTGIVGFNVIPIRINRQYQPEVLNGDDAISDLKEFEELCRIIEQASYTDQEYQIQVSEIFKNYRKSVKQNYKRNILKYNKFFLLQMFLLVIWRKISKQHI